jgi:hypothetical protein
MDKALLVGINEYPTMPLGGCVNDAFDVARFINEQYDIDANNIRLLTDDRATRLNILKRMRWLLSGLRAGDRALFLFSGHGAQCPERDAQGNVSKVYEAICPYDFSWSADGFNAISDKDFQSIFSNIPQGVAFMWVSDSCFSGGLPKTRALAALTTRKAKAMPVPADMRWRLDTAKKNALKPLGFKKAADSLNLGFLAACEAGELSYDDVFEGKGNGAFTHFFLKQLNADGKTKKLPQLCTDINEQLTEGKYNQHSQALGDTQICNRPFLTL